MRTSAQGIVGCFEYARPRRAGDVHTLLIRFLRKLLPSLLLLVLLLRLRCADLQLLLVLALLALPLLLLARAPPDRRCVDRRGVLLCPPRKFMPRASGTLRVGL